MITKAQVKHIQSLADKKYRDEAGVFVVEGDKVVREALVSGLEVQSLFATTAWLKKHEADIPAGSLLSDVSMPELERISQHSSPQQVLAVMKKPIFRTDIPRGFCILLDEVQDPGNVGSILRIADWFGISHVFLHGACADPFGPKVVQAAMGSLFRVNVPYVNGEEWLIGCENHTCIAATLDGQKLEDYGPCSKAILVIGNESRGVSPGLKARCPVHLAISGRGGAESLNAAVATGIFCHALLC